MEKLLQWKKMDMRKDLYESQEMKDAMEAITINAAKICRVDDRVGSLKVGKDADIAIFDDNPLETFTNTLYTIIDGEIVYRREE